MQTADFIANEFWSEVCICSWRVATIPQLQDVNA